MIYSVAELNQMTQEKFVAVLGAVFEDTPTIAQLAWTTRPFLDELDLHQKLVAVVQAMTADDHLKLICAHPDLGSKAKMAAASVQEQAGVGLDCLSPSEFKQFQSLNQQYREKFGFPFIIAVKHHTKASILEAFERRLSHDRATEQQQALTEIAEIARLRLTHLVKPLVVNRDRLMQTVDHLAEIGKLANGGVCRLAFSPEDVQARQQIATWMNAAGMTVRVDAAGNLIGRYAGTQPDAPALATGSHIDTVPVAGAFDGCLGVLAGIEVVRVLQENNLRLNHALEVIVFADEERSVIGSKAMAGQVPDSPEEYSRLDGTPIQVCLQQIGGNWAKIQSARRDRSQVTAFVELHVEQGCVLEHLDCAIGVVTGVVGQYRFAVDIIGRPNHAGTTPMHLRQDALVAAAQIVLAVNRLAVDTPGDQVATVGYLTVSPNATNTVPGRVDLRIDLRDLSDDHLQRLIARLHQDIQAIATATNTSISIRQMLKIQPTLATAPIMTTIESICRQLGYSYTHLPSRAGHDAQEIGRITDMGMIFVPSRGGISHSQDEYTSAQDCEQGANVLLKTFLQLDRMYSIVDQH